MNVFHTMRRLTGVALLVCVVGTCAQAQTISAVEVTINGVPATIVTKVAGDFYSFSLLSKNFPESLKNKFACRTECAGSGDGLSGTIKRVATRGVTSIRMSGF